MFYVSSIVRLWFCLKGDMGSLTCASKLVRAVHTAHESETSPNESAQILKKSTCSSPCLDESRTLTASIGLLTANHRATTPGDVREILTE